MAKRINGWASSADRKSSEAYEASNKDSDFLSLGEPIKVGHHSEKRHRKIIDQAWNNMENSVTLAKKAEEYRRRAEYWEARSREVNLSMPESLEFFSMQLEDAKAYHAGLKDGSIERLHSYSLTYARKKVKELEDKVRDANKLWG